MVCIKPKRSWVDANNKPLTVGDEVNPISTPDDTWVIYHVETSDRDYPIYYVYLKDKPDKTTTYGRDEVRKVDKGIQYGERYMDPNGNVCFRKMSCAPVEISQDKVWCD